MAGKKRDKFDKNQYEFFRKTEKSLDGTSGELFSWMKDILKRNLDINSEEFMDAEDLILREIDMEESLSNVGNALAALSKESDSTEKPKNKKDSPVDDKRFEEIRVATKDLSIESIYLEAWKHFVGYEVPQSAEEAVLRFTVAAEYGDARSQCLLGSIYLGHSGIPKSYEESAKWYRMAAEQNSVFGQEHLAGMYKKGKGVQKSAEEEVKWLIKAAEQGDVYCQKTLGDKYREGKDVPPNDKEAAKWYELAAENGDSDAQYFIGMFYKEGKGVPQSDEEAVKWFRICAEHCIWIGPYFLGDMYRDGRGVPQSDEEAIRLYKEGIEKKCPWSMQRLGWMYQYGRGVPQSDLEALKLYKKSVGLGVHPDKKDLEKLGMDVFELVDWEPDEKKQGNSKI